MSKIKDLKLNPDNNLNIISILELFSPDAKSKYTDTLLRLMKSTPNIKGHIKEVKTHISTTFDFISVESLDNFSDIQLLLVHRFLDTFFNEEDLKTFRKFCEYNERGLVAQNDLTKYKSFEEIVSSVSIAEMRVDMKEMETQIIKIHEDDEWLLLRPLTYASSKKYGSNTKWCTTQETNPEYFTKYSSKGVLIYCINKVNGYKVASFYSLDKNDPEFSYWNQKDSRIDSTDSELTLELIGFIRDYVKDPKVKTNRYMLGDDMRAKEDVLLKTKTYKSGSVPMDVEESTWQSERQLSTRIDEAIRRENEGDVTTQEEPEAIMEMSEMTELCETEPEPQSIIDRMTLVTNPTEEIAVINIPRRGTQRR
jgi:hypothetical protein